MKQFPCEHVCDGRDPCGWERLESDNARLRAELESTQKAMDLSVDNLRKALDEARRERDEAIAIGKKIVEDHKDDRKFLNEQERRIAADAQVAALDEVVALAAAKLDESVLAHGKATDMLAACEPCRLVNEASDLLNAPPDVKARVKAQKEVIDAARKIADAGALLASNYPHYVGELRKDLAALDRASKGEGR